MTDAGRNRLMVHRDNLSLLEQAAAAGSEPRRPTFLNPFDNLWWANDRDEVCGDSAILIEAYVPAAKGSTVTFACRFYTSDRLVGRLDPKLERKDRPAAPPGRLHLEPGVKPDEELIASVVAAPSTTS